MSPQSTEAKTRQTDQSENLAPDTSVRRGRPIGPVATPAQDGGTPRGQVAHQRDRRGL